MLKSLLPSSSFTTLRQVRITLYISYQNESSRLLQVLYRDARFREEISDLFAATQISTEGENVFLGASSVQIAANSLIHASTTEHLFDDNLASSNDKTSLTIGLPKQETVLPSRSRLISFLTLVLE